jgi:hypothetical protein
VGVDVTDTDRITRLERRVVDQQRETQELRAEMDSVKTCAEIALKKCGL